MKPKTKDLLLGVAVANAFVLLVLFITLLLVKGGKNSAAVWVLSDFVLLPICMGMINTYFWRKHTIRIGTILLLTLANFFVAAIITYLLMREGVICLIIVSPLLIIFILAGVLIGKLMFKHQHHKLNISIFSALLLFLLLDTVTASPVDGQVTDRILIHARPEQVWTHVVAFPVIEKEPDYVLFKLGLPYPVQSTAVSYAEGSERECIFSNGIVFDEKIVVYEPNHNLVFDITKQPEHPEILGHIELKRGQFLLHDNGDGTTTLEGTSWYRLFVKPSAYFDTWAVSIISNVHLRVMEHIKELSEG